MQKILLLFISISFVTTALAQVAGPGRTSAQGNFSQYLNKTLVDATTKTADKGIISAFNNEENTIGTRFFFNEWVEGDSLIDVQGNLINTTAFIFNFDKLTGGLLATQDKINNMLVSSSGIKSFVLKSKGKKYVFKQVETIKPGLFFLELVKSDAHYTLYKRFVTTYIAANFKTNGITESGNNYNEYKDENEYYIVDATTKEAGLLPLKAKALKAAFPLQKEKTDTYFKQHRENEIDEKFLTGLISYLNE